MQDKAASFWWAVVIADPGKFHQVTGIRVTRNELFRLCPHWALGSEAHDLARGLSWHPIAHEDLTPPSAWDPATLGFHTLLPNKPSTPDSGVLTPDDTTTREEEPRGPLARILAWWRSPCFRR